MTGQADREGHSNSMQANSLCRNLLLLFESIVNASRLIVDIVLGDGGDDGGATMAVATTVAATTAAAAVVL